MGLTCHMTWQCLTHWGFNHPIHKEEKGHLGCFTLGDTSSGATACRGPSLPPQKHHSAWIRPLCLPSPLTELCTERPEGFPRAASSVLPISLLERQLQTHLAGGHTEVSLEGPAGSSPGPWHGPHSPEGPLPVPEQGATGHPLGHGEERGPWPGRAWQSTATELSPGGLHLGRHPGSSWQSGEASEHSQRERVPILPSFCLSFVLPSPQFKGSLPKAPAASRLTPKHQP